MTRDVEIFIRIIRVQSESTRVCLINNLEFKSANLRQFLIHDKSVYWNKCGTLQKKELKKILSQ